jgi:hypothetical protein
VAAQEARGDLVPARQPGLTRPSQPEQGTKRLAFTREDAAMDKLPVNIVGLGLILAGLLFAYFLNFVGIIIGLIMIIGGIMALWMTYRRKKYAAT